MSTPLENKAPATDVRDTHGLQTIEQKRPKVSDLTERMRKVDLAGFERGLRMKKEAKLREQIEAEVRKQFYFCTPEYDEERRALLVSLSATWEPSVQAWNVSKDHPGVPDFKQVYEEIILAEGEIISVVEARLRQRLAWEAQTAQKRRALRS